MPFKVEVGPPQIAIHHGQTVLVTDLDAQIGWPSERGLFFFDTRVLSSWAIYANGVPWELLSGGATSYYTSKVFLTNRTILTEDGAVPPRMLGLVVSRSISGGMHEDLDITNNSMKRVRFQLEIVLRSDFADIFEVRSGSIVRRGRITTHWSDSEPRLRTTYRNADFVRSVTVAARGGDPSAVYANGRLSFEVSLAPGEAWHCCLLYSLADGDRHFPAPQHCVFESHKLGHAGTLDDWLRTVLKIRTSNEEFYRLYRQALEDMAALRLPIVGTDHMVFLPAAGLPWFVAPFGRDSLIVSMQNLLIYPGVRPRRARDPGVAASARARRLSRCGARQDPARGALWGARAFQAGPAHALLRNRRCNAALSHYAAYGMACDGRQRADRAAP